MLLLKKSCWWYLEQEQLFFMYCNFFFILTVNTYKRLNNHNRCVTKYINSIETIACYFQNILLTASADWNCVASEQSSIQFNISRESWQIRSLSCPACIIAVVLEVIHWKTKYKIIVLEFFQAKTIFWKESLPFVSSHSPWTWFTIKARRRGKRITPILTYDVFIVTLATDQIPVTEWEIVLVSYSIYTKKVDNSNFWDSLATTLPW